MTGGIFLLQHGGTLIEMTEQPYDTEAVLQELIASYPNLLAGDQMNAAAPRRWLLVSREIGVPDEVDGGDRWSLDHLFLDQDAVPTLVEVKRSTDTRIRREVVGQMLDYAVNAVVYWPVEAVRAKFEGGCGDRGADPAAVLAALVGPGADADLFWGQVKTNLKAGRIRMVFVADVIPPELRRIVEFLNGQMDPAEVLAVEVRQYVGQGLTTLVPRVVGQNVGKASEKQWDEASFFELLRTKQGEKEVNAARRIFEWARQNQLRIWWGKGNKDGSFYPMLDFNGETHWTVSVWTSGRVEIPFQWMLTGKVFGSEARRVALRDRLNTIPGVQIPIDSITRRPTFFLAAVTEEQAIETFLSILDWCVSEAKSR